jgi:hypothetical protein
MKKLFAGVAVLAFVMIAFSAMAQDIAKASDKVLAPSSVLGSVVGKMVSVYSDSNTSTTITGIWPSYNVVANTTVPAKYKSKSQWLIVNVTLQETCSSSTLATAVYVDNIAMYADDGGSYPWECSNSNVYEIRTKTYFLPPENLGGPFINPGAAVEVRAVSSTGTAVILDRTLVVQAIK